MIAIIERGNTRTKLFLLDLSGKIKLVKYWNSFRLDELALSISSSVRYVRYCNTSLGLESVPDNWIKVDAHSQWPFEIEYSSNLGPDRLALVLGAKKLSRILPVLVISCGTCLTFSYLNSKNIFKGGTISPGFQMRLKSMNTFTGSLPYVEAYGDQKTGQETTDTESSMHKGAFEGMSYEINQRIKEFQTMEPEINCFLVGGDGPAFASSLESGIFATSNLEAIGLFAQWKYEQTK
ncbi:MAG: Type III pantothenate kinase [Owenweeksia sp. TMED14]|nr:MAG: Type III pantothenate kinase [Owenweeksia sp. TMED14]